MNEHITRTALQECPHCGYAIDSIAPGGPKELPTGPSEGDFVICLACAKVCRCTADMRLVRSSVDDPDADAETRAELERGIAGIEYLRTRDANWPEKFRRRGPHRA